MSGVVVGAYVKVFTGQRYRFLGYLFEDGSFGMISALDVNPLKLLVAGISFELPFEMTGRLILTGRAKRDGYYGFIGAKGYGQWKIIEGIFLLEVGKRTPVELKVWSNGSFEIKGEAKATFFDNKKAFIEGSVDISQTHFFIDGKFQYNISYQNASMLDLMLNVKGRIGPQEHFMIAGGGNLKILGCEFANVKGEISDSGVFIETHLNTFYWYIGSNRLDCRLILDLKGSIDLRKSTLPDFKLLGDGSLELFGAAIEGRAGIIACNGFINTFIDGKLKWQGREWLNGRIALGSNGYVEIGGKTSFTLELTPHQLPSGIELTSLIFKIDLSGSFEFKSQGEFHSCKLQVDWMLGIRTLNTGNQTFPIAMKKLDISSHNNLSKLLIIIQNIKFLPIDNINITIPIPKFHNTETITLWEHDFGIGTLITPLKISDDDKKHQLPIMGYITTEDMNLNAIINDLNFEIFLAWKNDKLGIEIRRDNNTEFIHLR